MLPWESMQKDSYFHDSAPPEAAPKISAQNIFYENVSKPLENAVPI